MPLSPAQPGTPPWPSPEFAAALPPLQAAQSLAQTLEQAGRQYLAGLRPDWQRVYLGSDLCERLLPGPGLLRRWIGECTRLGLQVSLLSPALSDAGLQRLARRLPLLPAGSEVVINDWGALRHLRSHFAELLPVAGRALARMVKDPRLPDPRWTRLYPSAVGSQAYSDFLGRFGIARLELELPPFPQSGCLRVPGLAVSVYAPLGCSSKGRICRIGSLRQPRTDKFAAGHACGRECLSYFSRMRRDQPTARRDLQTWQCGNAMLYRQDADMNEELQAALSRGEIDRIVYNGALNQASPA